MNLILKMAWRNLWRNPRRTLISVSSIFFSALFCIIMISFMEGTMGYMINSVIERQTGHFQIMSPEYWDDRVPDNFITVSEHELAMWSAQENVDRLAPRMDVFAMAWNGQRTKPINLSGVDPEREQRFSKIADRMSFGSYLMAHDNGIIVGEQLAQSLSLQVGDTLTLIGQGYYGSNAAGVFPVRGVYRAFDPISDGRVAYTSLTAARNYVGMSDGVSSVAVVVKDQDRMAETIGELTVSSVARQPIAFTPWQELLKETAAGMASDKEAFSWFAYLLYVIVGFGLLSVIIILTQERTREFGVMGALGMRRGPMIVSMFVEMLFVGLIGVLVASVVSLPIVTYFHFHPLPLPEMMEGALKEFGIEAHLPFALRFSIFSSQILVVMVLTAICTLYPIIKIGKLNIINAIRG